MQWAVDALGRDSTATPDAPMDRYAASLARPSALLPQQGPVASEAGSRQQPAARLSGPPDLGTVSAGPAVPLDRYASTLARPSQEIAGQDVAGAAAASRDEQLAAPAWETVYHEQQQQQYQQQQQQHYPPHWQYQPDVQRSDLTATPGVPLARYAAMVAGPAELESPRFMSGSTSASSSATALPPRSPVSAARFAGLPAGRPISRSGSRGVPEAEEVEGEDDMLTGQRVGSWQWRRSLASLQATLQAIHEQGESAPGSDSD